MTERQLKYRVGIALVMSYITIILVIVVLRFINGFSTDEFTTLLGLVAPMFSGFTASILAFIVTDRNVSEDTSKPVTGAFILLTLLLPLLFAGLTILAIVLKAFNLAFSDFEDFKRVLIALESMFSVNVGILIYSLFPKKNVPASKARKIKPELASGSDD
jgi:hypothetical protein